jgi:hypothetical protein
MKKLIVSVFLMFGAFALISVAFNSKKDIKFIETHEIVEVELKDEYIWTLQRELSPRENINELLYYVELINGKKFHEYKEGDTILLFKDNVSM